MIKQLLLSLSFLLLFACTKEEKALQITYHKNLEVLFSVYNQTWTPYLDDNVSTYMLERTRLMKLNHDYFEQHQNHQAIQQLKKILPRSGTDYFTFAFYYSDFPHPKRIKTIPQKVLLDINVDTTLALKEIDSLMLHIADFYQEGKFDTFLKEHQHIYDLAINEVAQYAPNNQFIQLIENYFGEEKASYSFYVIPFFKSEFGQAMEVMNQDGTKEALCFVSPLLPQEIDSSGQVVAVGYKNETEILQWSIHEYAHLFFNPYLDESANHTELMKHSHLYQSIEGSPQIGDWYSYVAEHLAVAFEIRAAHLIGEQTRANILKKKHAHWPHLSFFIQQLKAYESNRETFTQFKDFAPLLIERIAKSDQ